MSQLSQIVSQLQLQRKQVQSELGCLDAAISALSNDSGTSPKAGRTMSAAGRRAISLAQKARWAKRNCKRPGRYNEAQAYYVSIGSSEDCSGSEGPLGDVEGEAEEGGLDHNSAVIINRSPPRLMSRSGLRFWSTTYS